MNELRLVRNVQLEENHRRTAGKLFGFGKSGPDIRASPQRSAKAASRFGEHPQRATFRAGWRRTGSARSPTTSPCTAHQTAASSAISASTAAPRSRPASSAGATPGAASALVAAARAARRRRGSAGGANEDAAAGRGRRPPWRGRTAWWWWETQEEDMAGGFSREIEEGSLLGNGGIEGVGTDSSDMAGQS
jgi:hypothetical protein